jgi:hypothetical protein
MTQIGSAQVFVVAAVVLIVVHRWVTNRWLAERGRRYGQLPGVDWWRTPDPDPTVERWRRLRILVLLPTVASFATALALLLTAR